MRGANRTCRNSIAYLLLERPRLFIAPFTTPIG